MNSVIKFGAITFFVSMLFISCGKEEEIETTPEDTTVTEDQEVVETSETPETKSTETPTTKTVSTEPETQEVTSEPETADSETADPEASEAEEPQVVAEDPELEEFPELTPEPIYASLILSGDVDIVFFEQGIVGLSQSLSGGNHLLWLVSGDTSRGDDFPIYLQSLVRKLNLYSTFAESSYDFMYQSVCRKRSTRARNNAFFKDVMSIGTFVSISADGSVSRFGTETESRIGEGNLKNYNVSSATVQNGMIASISLTNRSGSITLNRISAPEGLTTEEFGDVEQISLRHYYESAIDIQLDGFSACDVTS